MHATEPLMDRAARVATLVDCHVHLHPAFATVDALDHAVRNMAAAASALGLGPEVEGCLMLAETPAEDTGHRLKALARGTGPWTARPLGDGRAYRARRTDGASLLLVRGRQVPTRERLELLALGTAEPFPARPSLADAIARAHELGALPVIPWGFGKWWLDRGRRVREALDSSPPVVLGDNGGRLRGSWRPRAFQLADARSVPVLPGSDPLPFPGQVARVGSYGVVVDGGVDPAAPTRSLLRRLEAPGGTGPVFGRRTGLPGFLWYQAAMQLRRSGSR